ncbi:NADH-quinone oxidoreductase subunit J [Trichlorobacter sp.]|jgi:NADH-quinone oxidoreductase subunit J|uniref:NADH-quinone oxidoreductase subunit J n=1 Tax=Trichlorobacter sp. TaxID=2911007 RepID=UPI002A35DB03|nr:NADH-quinone oxidoreductase subunit J [Trichlorobacter sp.]MDY0383306.1 NADH-quinone oxidoreductase subunit J [Trichlorobacter sp.]
MDITSVFFAIVTIVAIVSALLVVTCKNPINSALSLVLTFFCLATYYAMLDAPFMAAIQIIVYAGAIMVLIVFTIMLLNIRVDANKKHTHQIVLGSVIGIVTLLLAGLFIIKGNVAAPTGPITPEMIAQYGHTELIGTVMFTEFLLPFEVTSILLLAAMVGAVVLAKKKLS